MYEFELAHDPGYFKLIWSILDVTHCPEHKVKLIDKCNHCGSYQGGFGFKISCNTCQKCNSNLSKNLILDDIIPSWELKGVDMVEFVDKIARDSTLSYPENGIKNMLSKIFDKVWKSDSENLLWAMIPRDEYLSLTCGNKSVSLKIARRFSVRLGIDLSDLLTGEFEKIPGLLESKWFKNLPKEFRPRKRTIKHNRHEILRRLTLICPSTYAYYKPISEISVHLGVSKGYLDYHFPEVMKRIKSKNNEWAIKKQVKKRHEAMVHALKYFMEEDSYVNLSRKDALKKIRDKTGLPKNILFEEINLVYKLLF